MFRRMTFLVIPHASIGSRGFSVSERYVRLGMWVLAAFVAISAYYTVGYNVRAHREAAIVALTNDQVRMEAQLRRLSEDITAARRRMMSLASDDELLRIAADMPQVDADVRRAGVGGSHGSFPIDGVRLEGRLIRRANYVQSQLGQLIRESEFQDQSLTDVHSRLDRTQDLLKHRPSSLPVSLALAYISSGYGYRRDPFTGRRRLHEGIDIAGPRGTPVYATADGVVRSAGYVSGLGHRVAIQHKGGYRTVYGHLNRVMVKRGQAVSRHEQIGEIGSSGRSTAPHLHYAVTKDRRPHNPWHYLPLE